MEELRQILTTLREAIENFDGIPVSDEWDEEINYRFKNFPSQSCEEASSYLANILKFKFDYDDVRIVRGNLKGGWGYHTWIKLNDIDLDITANQFDNCDQDIIVERNSKFHQDNFKLIEGWGGLIEKRHWPDGQIKYFEELLKIMETE